MGAFYGMQIKSGNITTEDVPKLWKASVEKWMKENP